MDQKSNKKIIIQFVCVILSFALWLYINNVENPIKESIIKNVPVELINVESLKNVDLSINTKEQGYTVDLSISGPANQIYSFSGSDFKLKVDLSQYALKQGENTLPVEIVDYPEGITIKNTNSLSVKVKVEPCAEKELSIESKIQLNYKSGFSEKSKSIEPESVKISGPKSLVDKVSKAIIQGKIDNISEDIEKQYDIILYDDKDNQIDGLELSDESANLSVEIQKGKDVPIKASLIGKLKDGLTLESSEISLSKVIISGDSDVIDRIDSIATSDIDLSSINASQQLEVSLVVPEGVTIENAPKKVSVKLQIKDAEVNKKTIYGVKINFLDMDTSKYKYEMVDTCDIVISGSEQDLKDIKSTDIIVEASLLDLTSEGTYNVNWSAKFANEVNASIINPTGTIAVKVSNI